MRKISLPHPEFPYEDGLLRLFRWTSLAVEDGEREWVWRDDVRLNFKQPPSEAILFSGITSLPTFDSELDLGSKIDYGHWQAAEDGETSPFC